MFAVALEEPHALVLADGFSCRSQIRELAADRRPMHVAQALAAALPALTPHEGAPCAERIGLTGGLALVGHCCWPVMLDECAGHRLGTVSGLQVAFGSTDDGALHQDVPGPGEIVDVE